MRVVGRGRNGAMVRRKRGMTKTSLTIIKNAARPSIFAALERRVVVVVSVVVTAILFVSLNQSISR